MIGLFYFLLTLKAALDKLWTKISNGIDGFGQMIFDEVLEPIWSWFSDTFPWR